MWAFLDTPQQLDASVKAAEVFEQFIIHVLLLNPEDNEFKNIRIFFFFIVTIAQAAIFGYGKPYPT